MNLTAEQMTRLLEVMSEAPDSTTPNEQRQHVRVGVRYKIKMAMMRNGAVGPWEYAWVRDISVGGVGLAIGRMLEAGGHLVVHLPGINGRTMKVVCEVRHCREVAEDIYNAGLAFVSKHDEIAPRPEPKPPIIAKPVKAAS